MQSVFLLWLAICCAGSLQAQITIAGNIRDEKEQALPGTTISLKIGDKLNQTVADKAGNFSFHVSASKASAILIIDFVGKKSKKIELDLKTDQFFQIYLEEVNLFLAPLEIQSIRASDKSPFTKTDISSQMLMKKNLGQDLPFLLNQLPSVTVTSDAGNGIGYTGIRIRGTDASRINVTLNGIPYNDAESQSTYFVDIPDIFSSSQSIQLQRGIGTSSNGGGAFGATINIATNEFIDSAYMEASNTYGTFNTWRNAIKAGTGLLNNHFTADLRLSHVSSDGYIDRATSNLQSLYFSGAYFGKNASLRFNFITGKEKTYQAWYGVPEALLKTDPTYNPAGMEKPDGPYENQTDNYTQTHYQLFYNQKLNTFLDLNIVGFLTRGKGYYEEYKADEPYAKYGLPNIIIGNDTIAETDLVRRRWLDNYFYGQLFSLQYQKGKHAITLGGNWSQYNGQHFGQVIWAEYGAPSNAEYYRLPAYKSDQNVYVKWLYNLNKQFSLFNDVQYRHVHYTMEGFVDNPSLHIQRNFQFINPKTGISFNDAHTHAYFSYGFAGKEPNRDDFEAAIEEQPRAEFLHDFEWGIERKMKNYRWGATVYYMLYKNQLVLTGKVNTEGSYTRINVPSSYRLGVELTGALKINDWLNINANATFSRNKIKQFTEYIDNYDNGKQEVVQHNHTDISFSPSIISALSIDLQPIKNLSLSLESKYVSDQFLDNTQNEDRILPGYFNENFRITYSAKKFIFRAWDLILQINNLFNQAYQSNGATYPYIYNGELMNDNYYYPMAGTNFLLGLKISF